jgi:hypothetical protein
MKSLRSVARFALQDFKRNTEIRNHLENQNRNYEHVLRMDENKLPKILLNYKPEGR